MRDSLQQYFHVWGLDLVAWGYDRRVLFPQAPPTITYLRHGWYGRRRCSLVRRQYIGVERDIYVKCRCVDFLGSCLSKYAGD